MKVLITGGSGFIGQPLCRRLAAHGHELTVLSRQPRKAARGLPEGARLVTSLDDIENDAAIDGIVNLAGESLFAGRWTERRKKTLFASRVGVTEDVVGLVSRLDRNRRCWFPDQPWGSMATRTTPNCLKKARRAGVISVTCFATPGSRPPGRYRARG